MAIDTDINEALLKDIYEIYSQAETEMLEKVTKRVKKGITTEGWTERKLSEVQELKKDIEKTIKSKCYKGQALISEDIISAYTKGKISATIDAGKKAKKTSSIDMSGITSKKLKESIQTAFDFAKGMEGLPQDPDSMFKKVVYATGTMETKMIKTNAGAQVIGDTIYVCKPYQKYIDDEFIMHEIGHKVTKYGTKTTDASQKEAAEELAKKLGYSSVKSMSMYVSEYAAKNPTELYPEVLMEYYKSLKTGKPLMGNKKKVIEAVMEQMYNDPKKKKEIEKSVMKFAKGIHTSVLDEFDIPMNLKQLILATNKLLNNASFQILRNAEDAYTKIMANATTGLLAGTDTRIQASQKMLNEMSAKGITSFVDKSGRNWSLSSYAEMCARTVSAHSALQGHIDRQLEVGEDLVKVSSIGTTCPICQRWQGVVLSISGKSPKYHSLEEAKSSGLFHPNCKHTLGMYIPELDDGTEHEGKVEPSSIDMSSVSSKRNKLIEQQRANERKIRYWKDRKAVAITDEEKSKCSEKVKAWQYKNLIHCEKNNLRRQYSREKTYVGNSTGQVGAPIGGNLKEYENLYKDVIGEDSKKAYKTSKKLYGAKEITYEKWLKDEIQSLEQLDIDKAQMKDASNKAVTPTSLYKKYIGDNPMNDWSEVSPFEKGTKEYKSGYAKWLKQQIEEIGVSYKIKPKYVDVHEDIPLEDTKLSATEIYKKYHDGKKPTDVFKELGGEEGTGMKYGKWVETQKKELIKSGITKTVPFENATTQKTSNTISQASQTIESAKSTVKKAELDKYQKKLDDKVHGAYDGYLQVKEMLEEYNGADSKEEEALFEEKLKLAEKKHLEMVKKKAEKTWGTSAFDYDLNKLTDMLLDETDEKMHEHIDNQIKMYYEVKKTSEQKDPMAKYKTGIKDWQIENALNYMKQGSIETIESELNYYKGLLQNNTPSWKHYDEVKLLSEMYQEALEGTLGMNEKEKEEFLKKKKEEEKAAKAKAAKAVESGKISLGRETSFKEGKLVRSEEIYQELDYSDLDILAKQAKGNQLMKAYRRDVIGRDKFDGHNHHMGHNVTLVPGADPELGEAMQLFYDEYINTIKCKPINDACVKGYEHATQSMKKKIDAIDKVISSCEIDTPVKLHRFVSDEVAQKMFGKLDMSELSKGKILESPAFMSSTVSGHPTFEKRNFMMTIQCDKGTHMMPTLNYEEGEVLLGRGGKLEVVDIIDHTKSGKKLKHYDGTDGTFKGKEIVVRYIEQGKASQYEVVTPEKIDKILGKNDIVSRHTKESKQWIASLSSKEKKAAVDYTGSWFSSMNDVYRRNNRSDKDVVEHSENLTKAMRKISISEPVVLRRGIHKDDLAHMLGFNGDFYELKKHIDEINEGGYAAEDKGFLSCSPYSSGGFTKDVELRIYCPTGSHAAYVADISHYKSEKETFIQSGSMYKVLKLKHEQGKWIAYLELLGTD